MFTLPPVDTRTLTSAEYRKQYNKGWNKSGGDGKSEEMMDVSEDRFLARNGFRALSVEHHAWIDGWLDYAAARDKYHFETCDGECGLH